MNELREHEKPPRPRKLSDAEKLAEAITDGFSLVAREACLLREQKEKEFEWFKSHHGLATKQDLKEMENRIMASQAELAAELKTLTAEAKQTKEVLQKVSNESSASLEKITALDAKVQELTDQINQGGTITPELQEAFNELKTASGEALAAAQSVDNLVPDPTTPPEPPTPA